MFSFLLEEKTLAFLTYLSIILTVYYSIRTRHKKIKYVILRNEKNYVIAFWNACSQAIFKEDLHHLYCLVNVDAITKYSYSTDRDIDLPLTLGDDCLDSYRGRKFTRHTRRMDLRPDFLNPKAGFIVELENRQPDNYLPATLFLFGRIRGENEASVHWITPLDLSLIKNPRELIERLLSILSSVLSLITFILTIGGSYDLLASDFSTFLGSVYGGLLIVLLLFAIFITSYNIYVNSAPREIKKKIQEYKDSGFHEVTMYYFK